MQLLIRLTPKASCNKIHGWVENQEGDKVLKVSVTTVPENGKANKALIALLSKELKLPKSDIQIKKGAKSKNKVLILNDISKKLFNNIKQ